MMLDVHPYKPLNVVCFRTGLVGCPNRLGLQQEC